MGDLRRDVGGRAAVAAVAIAVAAASACAPAAPVETLSLEGASFTLGRALRIGDGSVAIVNMGAGACDAWRGDAALAPFADEDPLLIGLFGHGDRGVANVEGDDPRIYATSDAADDSVVVDREGDAYLATVHLTFDRVVRTEWIGIDFAIVETPVHPPVVLDVTVAASPCP